MPLAGSHRVTYLYDGLSRRARPMLSGDGDVVVGYGEPTVTLALYCAGVEQGNRFHQSSPCWHQDRLHMRLAAVHLHGMTPKLSGHHFDQHADGDVMCYEARDHDQQIKLLVRVGFYILSRPLARLARTRYAKK